MEQNVVLNNLYNSLMQVPHRNYEPLVMAFRSALREQPAFASRAAVFVYQNSQIRDQVDCAVIALLQADPDWREFREAGQVMLLGNSFYETNYPVPGLEPYRVFRIAEWIKNSDRKIPRRMRALMGDYLGTIQQDQDWFESIAILNRQAMRDAYHNFNVRSNELSASIKYKADPPEGSKLQILKKIANSGNVQEQASLVIQHKIPYKIAQSLFPDGFTPEVGIALIDVMSPNEALNSRGWVERSGLLRIPEVRDVYLAKVSKVSSIASAEHRKSSQGSDEDVQAAINQGKEDRVAEERETKRIGGTTDIWMDLSSSMNQVLGVTPHFSARIWPLCDDVAIIAHNTSAWEIVVKDTGNPLQDVQAALRGQRAGGGTHFYVCLNKSRELGRNPQRIIMLTDGGENGYGDGRLASALERYVNETGVVPQLTMIHVPGSNDDVLTRRLANRGFEVEKFEFRGDYYLFDQVVAFLQGDVPKSLVERIMELELPRRVK